MLDFFKSLYVTIVTFTRIPLPSKTINNFGLSMVLLPDVGILIGLSLWGWQSVTDYFVINQKLVNAGYLIIPIALVGGIHLDGFTDVVDAFSSHADRDKILTILKDPHVGAFSVIVLIVYFIWLFVLIDVYFEHTTDLMLFGSVFVISRSLASFMGFNGKLLKESNFLAAMRKDCSSTKFSIVALLFAILASLMVVLNSSLIFVISPLIAAFAQYVIYRNAVKRFGGINGDVVGYSIVVNEIVQLSLIVLILELL